MNVSQALTLMLAMAITASASTTARGAEDGGHFHPKGKPPSSYTHDILRQAATTLPFADKRDFDEAPEGFHRRRRSTSDHGRCRPRRLGHGALRVAAIGARTSRASTRRCSGSRPQHELRPVRGGARRVYQVRGFDLANISSCGRHRLDRVRPADHGRDRPGSTRAVQREAGQGRPVVGVVYSHSHVDHWAGVRGVVDEADVRERQGRC